MTLLASGKSEGIQRFGNSVEHLLAALAPGLAMCLVGLLTVALQKNPALGFIRVELSFCTLLALPVFSWFFAKKWGREELWLRYATAASWCEWITVLVSAIAMAIGSLLFSSLAETTGFAIAIVFSSDLYGIWLGVFVAKVGLRLSWPRAVILYGSIRSASSKNGETFEELSLEDRRLLGLFRVVDITSRAEVMRWLEIRASAQSVLRRRGDPFTNQLWHLYSSLAQS